VTQPFGVLHTALINAMAEARLIVGWDRDPAAQDITTVAAA
jgi:hypothetical protein